MTSPKTVGDLLLTHVAERLSESVRQSDSVSRHGDHEPSHALARLGGDEFTILLTTLPQPEDAGRVARRIFDSLAHPFIIDGHEIFVSASIGICYLSIGRHDRRGPAEKCRLGDVPREGAGPE